MYHTCVQQTASTGFATSSSTASLDVAATPGEGGVWCPVIGADELVNEAGPAGTRGLRRGGTGTGGLRRPVEAGREPSRTGGLRRPVIEAGDAGTDGLRRAIFVRAADSRPVCRGGTAGLRRDGAGESATAGLRRPNGEEVRRVRGIFGIVVGWVASARLLRIFRSKHMRSKQKQ